MNRPVVWSGADLARVLDLAPEACPDVRGMHIDTRRLAPGDLFVALRPGVGGRPGDRDGHDFVGAARAAGAAAALVAERRDDPLPQLVVPDPLRALEALGVAARERLRARGAPVIAVTGSAGKTTCKNLLARVLACPASEGSFNNDLGVPLTLARTPADAPALVVEIGMNAPGEIAPLSRLAAPDVAIVLNVLRAHRGAFSDEASHRAEKLAIAAGLPSGGPLVVPERLPLEELPRTDVAPVTFGSSADARIRLIDADGAGLELAIGDAHIRLPWTVPGRHRRTLALAAVAALSAAGLDVPGLAPRFGTFSLPEGRGRRVTVDGIDVFDDAYNANPDSMLAALDDLAEARPGPGGRRVAVLGEMLELGAEEHAWHVELASPCARLDRVLLFGARMRALADALGGDGGRAADGPHVAWYPDADALTPDALARELRSGDRVLVKGSNTVFWKVGYVPALLAVLRARSGGGAAEDDAS